MIWNFYLATTRSNDHLLPLSPPHDDHLRHHLLQAFLLRGSLDLTTMLVMTTIFISKMEGLPHTSDIKMIDIWLIFCQLVPFSEVVLLTAMEHLRDNDDLMMMGSKNGNITLKRPFMKQRQNTYILVLKAIGMYLKSFMNALPVNFLFSEKRALPVIAVLAFLAYSCLALYFYYN